MHQIATYFFLGLLLAFIACGTPEADKNTDTEVTATTDVAMPDETPEANLDNTAIYEVDAEDPYLISNGEFLGLQPGMSLAEAEAGLRKGILRTGEGDFTVYYIDGAEGDELGYLMPDPRDAGMIGNIYVTAKNVVTERGIRVGNSFAELQKRVGELEVHGSEIEGRVYANKDGLGYRLDTNHFEYELDPKTIKPETEITEIVLGW